MKKDSMSLAVTCGIIVIIIVLVGNFLSVDFTDFSVNSLLSSDGRSIYPYGMTESGKELFGDGQDDEGNDLFTKIEKWIWGD